MREIISMAQAARATSDPEEGAEDLAGPDPESDELLVELESELVPEVEGSGDFSGFAGAAGVEGGVEGAGEEAEEEGSFSLFCASIYPESR